MTFYKGGETQTQNLIQSFEPGFTPYESIGQYGWKLKLKIMNYSGSGELTGYVRNDVGDGFELKPKNI